MANKKTNKLGLLFLIPGIILIIIAFLDFFSGGFPELFFLFFIGMPLTFIGYVIFMNTNLTKIARYRANRINPIIKDSYDYINENKINCPKCEEQNDKDAEYCEKCGTQLKTFCKYCGEEISFDSQYCKKCGRKVC